MRKLDFTQVIVDIQNWIRNYVESANMKGIVLGISGGIDSAVITTLCVGAIGKNNVIGLGLPCYSNPQDLEDAKMISDFLDIKFMIFNLTGIYDKILRTMSSQIKSNEVANANLKARLRMIINYFIGQSNGSYLVAGTSNRTEIAIGYFTKYGDGGVDFEPIGDLYKCEVLKIAEILEIPKLIITKPPSAGLWEGQTDEGEIGLSYDKLDEIIYRIDYNLELDDLNKEEVKKVRNMMRSAQHKLEMPPIFKIR
ncbi:MAG: NAD+ synthase [Promethearchaeota archaeon]